MKTKRINYIINHVDLYTNLPFTIQIEQTPWYKRNKAIVTLLEYYREEPKLVVQPRFEEIANDIYRKHLSRYNLKNIKWLHYNEYMNKYDSNATERYCEVKTQIHCNEIVGAEWEVVEQKFELN